MVSRQSQFSSMTAKDFFFKSDLRVSSRAMFGGTNASERPQPSRMRQSTRSRFSRYLRSFPRLEQLRSIRVTLSSLAKREIKVNVEGEGESPSPVKLIRERFRDFGKRDLLF